MKLSTFKDFRHFILYCALFYNQPEATDGNELVYKLQNKVVSLLSNKNVPHLDMPMHAYHYLMCLYNPNGYTVNNLFYATPEFFFDYIDSLYDFEDLKTLYKEYEPDLNERLAGYESKFDYLHTYFSTHYAFKPKQLDFNITRNWDGSGKCIPAKNEINIFVGWKIKGLNMMQVLHEITHSFIDMCDIKITSGVLKAQEECPQKYKSAYMQPKTFANESLIRALVLYLDRVEGDTFDFGYTTADEAMILPQLYLNKLESDDRYLLTQDYLNNISI